MDLDPERFDRPKPGRVLMEGGKWVVPEEQRPSVPLVVPVEAPPPKKYPSPPSPAPPAGVVAPTSKKSLEVQPPEPKVQKESSPWADVRPVLANLKQGESVELDVPKEADARTYQSKLRSVLLAWHETQKSKWSVWKVGGRRLRVERREPWRDLAETVEVIEEERTEERIETRVTERSVTTTTTAIAVDEPAAPAFADRPISSYFIDAEPHADEQLFLNLSLRYWSVSGASTMTDLEADDLSQTLPDLAEKVNAWREASKKTDAVLGPWARRHMIDGDDDTFGEMLVDLWDTVRVAIMDAAKNGVDVPEVASK